MQYEDGNSNLRRFALGATRFWRRTSMNIGQGRAIRHAVSRRAATAEIPLASSSRLAAAETAIRNEPASHEQHCPEIPQISSAPSSTFAGLCVGLIGPIPPPAGGMANQTRQLAELLRESAADVHTVATNPAYRPAWAAQIPLLRAALRLPPYLLELWRAAGRSDVFHVMANSGWSWHLFAVPAIWIARLRDVPVIINYRGGEAAQFLERSARLVHWSMRRASALAVPSRFLEQIFMRFGMRAQIVPNVVDLRRFSPRPTRNGREPPHLIVTRNLELLYDIATALRAFAQIREKYPQALLTVAGSGPDEARLKQLTLELGIGQAVRFVGRLDREQIAELYRCADLTLNPSLADNMPNSVLESLASGVPVVSTDVGGIPFLLEDGVTALLVAPAQPGSMADAALRLLDDAALWKRLSNAGITEAQRYTWSRVAPLLSNLYQAALTVGPSLK